MGQVHEYLVSLGVDYAVLRPTWFMDNFWVDKTRLDLDRGEIYSATGQGRLPWISVEDIGAVGYRALTDAKSHNTDYIIVGPELLSYDDVAKVLTEVTGQKIVHINLTSEEFIARLLKKGIPEGWSNMLARLEDAIKSGAEERTNDNVLKFTGRPPKTFRGYALENKARLMH